MSSKVPNSLWPILLPILTLTSASPRSQNPLALPSSAAAGSEESPKPSPFGFLNKGILEQAKTSVSCTDACRQQQSIFTTAQPAVSARVPTKENAISSSTPITTKNLQAPSIRFRDCAIRHLLLVSQTRHLPFNKHCQENRGCYPLPLPKMPPVVSVSPTGDLVAAGQSAQRPLGPLTRTWGLYHSPLQPVIESVESAYEHIDDSPPELSGLRLVSYPT